MKKILFLTTSNLATNPRLFKELRIAGENYETLAVCFKIGGWSDVVDDEILKTEGNLNVTYLSALRKPYLLWFTSSLIHTVTGKIWSRFNQNVALTAFSSNKRSFLLWKYLRSNLKSFNDFDFIVAHNLGALFPAYYASKKLNIPFIFDMEDFYPGEKIHQDAHNEVQRREFLLKGLLPKAEKVTAASPLIAKETEKLTGVKNLYIANSFYSEEFTPPAAQKDGNVLSLVWFSQNIDAGRGLEICITALDNFPTQVSLTLIGNLNEDFAKEWINGRAYINIKEPMLQTELHKELANYDIGLALEMSNADFNRELALTNKILAYLQSGLFLLATDTLAQKALLNQFEDHGLLCNQNAKALSKGISELLKNKDRIRSSKLDRYYAAKSLAFENEAEKLKTVWKNVKSKTY